MTLLLTLVLALAGNESQGAGCHAMDSDSVLARDVAAAVPAFGQFPPDFLLGYVQSSGAPHVFHGADLERIARNRGVELHDLPDVCFSRRTFIPSEVQIREAMQKTLAESFKIGDAKIEIVASLEREVPSGELTFPRSGIQMPAPGQSEIMWHGSVRYGETSKVPVWARVRVTAPMPRVVATSEIAAGHNILPSQVRMETADDSPLDESVARDLDDVVGYLSKATVHPGGAIRKTQIERPADVARGESVRVEVYEGAAHLVIEATAQTSGMKGATITVRNPSSGKEFHARVIAKGVAVIGDIPKSQGSVP